VEAMPAVRAGSNGPETLDRACGLRGPLVGGGPAGKSAPVKTLAALRADPGLCVLHYSLTCQNPRVTNAAAESGISCLAYHGHANARAGLVCGSKPEPGESILPSGHPRVERPHRPRSNNRCPAANQKPS
jgi:hypothetical protein